MLVKAVILWPDDMLIDTVSSALAVLQVPMCFLTLFENEGSGTWQKQDASVLKQPADAYPCLCHQSLLPPLCRCQ